MELKELIEELAKKPKDQVVTALKEHGHPVFQEVFNLGHSKATADAKAEREALEASLSETKADLGKAQGRVKELEEKAPDAAKLREQYEQEVEGLKAKHKGELEERDTRLRDERMERAVTDLKSKLIAAGLDPEYAEVKVDKSEVRQRLRHSDKGELEVLQNGKEIPFTPADGKSGLDLLAAEIREGTDPKWISSKADRGSDTGTSRGSGAGSGLFDRIRDETKKREDGRTSQSSPEERLGQAVGASAS